MKYDNIEIKNELLYLFLILIITEIFNFSVLNSSMRITIILGLLGLILLIIWFARTFSLYSKKKISKYSNVLMKISLKDRFFSYFVLPTIFYSSLLIFLFFNRNELLSHIVIGMCMIFILVLFLNVKSSLGRHYFIHMVTKAVFDFICITILYLLLNAFLRLGLSLVEYSLVSLVSSLILFLFVLKLHDRFGIWEILSAFISSAFVTTSMIPFWNRNLFIIPAIGSLMFYLIISLWNIRFIGKVKFGEYMLPVVYVVFALILILTM